MAEEEARRIRRGKADWEFIEKQPTKIRAALKYHIEKGDIRTCLKLSGLDIEDFREIMRKANVLVVL